MAILETTIQPPISSAYPALIGIVLNSQPQTCSPVFVPPDPFSPVIDDYIMPLVAELVRDQIAYIVSGELVNLKALAETLAATQPATLVGKQAQADLDNGIYGVIDNIFIEKGTHFTEQEIPGINIYYGRSDYPQNEGDPRNRQVSDSSYIISVHITEKHKQENDEISLGDEKSARNALRIVGIIRGILMSGQYVTLGSTFKGILFRRWVSSVDVFQPDFQESDGRHGIMGVLNISVKFNEIGPEIDGEKITAAFTDISAKLRTNDEGRVIRIEQ